MLYNNSWQVDYFCRRSEFASEGVTIGAIVLSRELLGKIIQIFSSALGVLALGVIIQDGTATDPKVLLLLIPGAIGFYIGNRMAPPNTPQ